MRIKIDMNGNSPAYIQMSAQIAAAIRAGEYRTGDKLPSEAEFCHETGLAKGTVRKTFDKLEEEGYIRRVHGSGTYVQGWQPELRRMVQFDNSCKKEGMKPDECYRLLKEACGRFFAADIPDQAAMIDCTPEIAGDITRELVKIWNFDMKYYQIDGVRAGTFIPSEEIWITTKTHFEEILPVAEKAGKALL
ncbi:GntR family transcriptional regulator [[Clostridium] symbiosum]|nr:GntR family transcriptional regulator [[Clostridium] symbiosum]